MKMRVLTLTATCLWVVGATPMIQGGRWRALDAECNCDVSLIFAPECGSNGKTYVNTCHMMKDICEDGSKSIEAVHEGMCSSVQTEFCELLIKNTNLCKMDKEKHCGSDGINYNNHCEFIKAKCKNPKLFLTRPRGERCEDAMIGVVENEDYCKKMKDENCAAYYKPVCGSDGVTYPNICVFRKEQCSNSLLLQDGEEGAECKKEETNVLEQIHKDACNLMKHTECTKQYIPVCGSDHNTYDNNCLFQAARCKNRDLYRIGSIGLTCDQVDVEGESGKVEGEDIDREKTCQRPCTREYNPVCGSDGVTYPNMCSFKIAVCINNKLQQAQPTGEVCNRNTYTEEKEKADVTTQNSKEICSDGYICQQTYLPICGNDGNTYTNLCEFQRAQCKKPRLETVKPIGEACLSKNTESESYSESLIAHEDSHSRSRSRPHKTENLDGTPKKKVDCQKVKDQKCTRMYRPVCANDGETYGNECLFLHQHCKDKTLKLVHRGECQASVTRGGKNSSTKTIVPLHESDESDSSDGPDELTATTKEDKCMKACSRIYKPVCGSDGNTYSNMRF